MLMFIHQQNARFPSLNFRLILRWNQTSASGSSRIGIISPVQAHHALEDSAIATRISFCGKMTLTNSFARRFHLKWNGGHFVLDRSLVRPYFYFSIRCWCKNGEYRG
jgi:hypothetical protein